MKAIVGSFSHSLLIQPSGKRSQTNLLQLAAESRHVPIKELALKHLGGKQMSAAITHMQRATHTVNHTDTQSIDHLRKKKIYITSVKTKLSVRAGSVSEDVFVALHCYSNSGCDLPTDWVDEVRGGGNCEGMFSYSLND